MSNSGNRSTSRITKSSKSNLKFPVSRIRAFLKAKNFANRVSDAAAVYLTAVLQYLTAEVLEQSLVVARSISGSNRIQPEHINVAMKKDRDFQFMFRTAIFPASAYVSPTCWPYNALPSVINEDNPKSGAVKKSSKTNSSKTNEKSKR